MKSKKLKSAALNRREMFLAGGFAAGLLGPRSASAAARLPMRAGGPEVYSNFGVRPFINCTSTYTINGGSAMLPGVIEVMNSASYYPVNLDELMEGAGKRLAELLQVESAMVSSGTAGSMTCATLACVAGGDPEKMQQLPDTTGLKGEVIVPRWSRSVYDHAVRSTGVKMIEVETLEDLERAFSPRTAMATGQINLAAEGNPFTLEQYVAAAHKRGVPVAMDCADRLPLVPNPYISRGVDLVAYSGGKIIRGPQTAGMLLGRKDLIAAAFMNSAPHHAFARAMKVSKEEVVGMVRSRRTAAHRQTGSGFRGCGMARLVPAHRGHRLESPRRVRSHRRAERQAILPHHEGHVGPTKDRHHGRRGRAHAARRRAAHHDSRRFGRSASVQ